MVKAGNPLCGVFVVAPSGTAQLNHFIGSFPERGYAANPPSVCLSRPLVFQNVPTQVFKGDVRLSGESRNLRHPPTATPSKVRAATKPVPKITQIKRITVQDQAPPTSHHITPPPVFPPKAGTPTHPPPQPPRRSGRQPNQSQKSLKSNESQFKTTHPPTATPSKVRTATKPVPKITQIKRITVQDQAPPTSHHTTTPPVFPPKAGTHAPYPPSVYPRVAVDATPPTRLSGESRNLRHPPPQPPRRSGRQPNQSQKSLKSNESQFKTKRPPPATTQPPPPVFPPNPEPNSTLHTPHSTLRTPHSHFQILPDTRHFPTPNTPPYHNVSQTRNVPPGHADQIQPATEATRCTDVRKSR